MELEKSNIAKVNQIQEKSETISKTSKSDIPDTEVVTDEKCDIADATLPDSESSKPNPEDRSPTPPRGRNYTAKPKTNIAQASLNSALEKLTPFNRFSKMQEKAKLKREKALLRAKG